MTRRGIVRIVSGVADQDGRLWRALRGSAEHPEKTPVGSKPKGSLEHSRRMETTSPRRDLRGDLLCRYGRPQPLQDVGEVREDVLVDNLVAHQRVEACPAKARD